MHPTPFSPKSKSPPQRTLTLTNRGFNNPGFNPVNPENHGQFYIPRAKREVGAHQSWILRPFNIQNEMVFVKVPIIYLILRAPMNIPYKIGKYKFACLKTHL
jgi:hypothetical protein